MTSALHFTADDEANSLLAQEPMALLIGFALDQQVPVPTAFTGPLKIKQRVGTLDPHTLATTDRELAAVVDEEYAGDASRLWTEAKDGADLRKRIADLPGFGEMKIKALGSVLAKRFDVAVAQDLVPNHPTLGDVDSAEALEEYQAKKRAYKSARRQAEAQRQA